MSTKKKINYDTGMALFFFVFSGFAYWQITELPTGFGEGVIGPSFFPAIVNTVIFLLGMVLFLRSIFRSANVKTLIATPRDVVVRMLAFLGLLFLYAFSYESLGFFVASALVMVLGLLLLGERRPLYLFLFPSCVIGLAWFGFAKLMKVALPAFSLF